MFIEQFISINGRRYSYYVESSGEAAIIDPGYDVQKYISFADERKASIKYIFVTHLHADFVCGCRELAERTNAKIIFGRFAPVLFDVHFATEGHEFGLGETTLKVLHTPGHSFDSISLLMLDENKIPHSVFTGEALLIGDVGRPQKDDQSGLTETELAGLLFQSVHATLLTLPVYVIIYPGKCADEGAENFSKVFSTIGQQKSTSLALRIKSREDFIAHISENKTYSLESKSENIAEINTSGAPALASIMKCSCRPVEVNDLKNLSLRKEVVIVDTREEKDFIKAHIPGSVFLGENRQFEATAGIILKNDFPVVIIAAENKEVEIISRLAEAGISKIKGYLSGGMQSWLNEKFEVAQVKAIPAKDFAQQFRYCSCIVIDVRNPDEWIPGFVAGAKLISLDYLVNHIKDLDPRKPCLVYCLKGYRSLVACSVLVKNGFADVTLIEGGMNQIRKTAISIRQLSSVVG